MAQREALSQVRISVRNLVEFVMRSGDLDDRRMAGAKKEAMQAGSRLHRKIQRRMGSDYQAEVSLKHTVKEDSFELLIEGRADGIITEPGGVTIDEIKCIYMDPGRLEEPDPVHMAQALCYGTIYAVHHDLEEIGIQLTYCNIETEEIRRFKEVKTREELEDWFKGLIHEYVKWARYLYHHRMRRQECLKTLQFPYAYREGQKELAACVYRSVAEGRNLYIQAPTGVGKTLSTVFPSLKAMGEGYGEKLFYLTARTITRSVAEEAFDILRGEKGLYFNTVTITAKEKLCVLEKPSCNPYDCPRAKGHFDRVNDAVYEIIGDVDGITREKVLEYAGRYQICPFEFCLDISNWVDGIICDYNYVFDPNVSLKRYFDQGEPGQGYLFLVDEAHNLVPRAREMYSASLCKEEILRVKRQVKHIDVRLTKRLEECNRQLLELKRNCDGVTVLDSVMHVYLKLLSLMAEMERFLEDYKQFAEHEDVLKLYFEVRMFITVYEKLDENYLIYAELARDGEFFLRLFWVNPAVNLKEYIAKGNSTILFSATLLPIQYYKELLSTEKDDYAVYAHSSFPQENKFLFIGTDVSTRYTRRGESTYQRFARYIAVMAEQKKGNYMAFFPSYRFLEEVHTCFLECVDHEVDSICQVSYMDEEQREEFLEEFEQEREKSLVAFCVMGGIFSEGIDLTDDKLIGAVIAGTGLPQVCTEREILKQYFNAADMDGFDYAYLYPGMNKVLQSAGRVIRTESDRGVILLLDDRFRAMRYREVFPREWQQYQLGSVKNLEQEIRTFWESP